MENSFDNFDGVIKYEAALGMTPIMNNPYDADNFYDMDGICNCGQCPMCEEKSNALGGLLPSRAERIRNRKRRQIKRDARAGARLDRKGARANAKLTQAQSSKIAAQSMGRESATDVELAKALSNPVSVGKQGGGGLSQGAKIGIIIGSVVVLGAIGFFVYKKYAKKGK
jgi:ribosomal protein L18